MSACYVCKKPPAEDADVRNPLCSRCMPARAHVVSMQREGVFFVAQCRGCGWDFKGPVDAARERAVKAHWRLVIREAGK